MGARGTCWAMAGIGLLLANPHSAFAQQLSKEECARAYESVQTLRAEGKLRDAKRHAILCADSSCPPVVSAECATWSSELTASLPTVIFIVRDSTGKERYDVGVTQDGIPLASSLDGRAVTVDPGRHEYVFRLSPSESMSQQAMIREADKNVRIVVDFRKSPEPNKEGPSVSTAQSPPVGTARSAGVPASVYLLAGVGLLAIGSFAYVGTMARGEEKDLIARCNGECLPEEGDSVRRKNLIADISLGVGVLSLGAAGVLYLFRPKERIAPTVGATNVGFTRDGVRLIHSWQF